MMARKKQRPAAVPATSITDPIDRPPNAFRVGGVELIVVALILFTLFDAATSRYALNPDGVSYLDLAARLSAGDWGSFVQGYWSPAYPTLIALVAVVGGKTPATLLTDVHFLNGVVVIGAIILVWWWSRRAGGPLFARAALAALFLVSSRLPRIEAVTPDVIHLALMVWLGYELLVERGRRWLPTGLLLGATYLVKTSAWPWLLLSFPLRLWGARNAEGRKDVLRSLLVAAPLILIWVVPLSLKAGHLTFGSAGRLNYCWYIDNCDSRTPDTHRGAHVAYHTAAIDSSRSITWAEFDAERWTYSPWSDPTEWEGGVRTRAIAPPSFPELVAYWGRQAGRSFGFWLLPMLAAVILPWGLLEWRAERRRWWWGEGRPVLVVALLGFGGIFQFILIHAEPRLIAPYGILLGLAVLHGASSETGSAAPRLSTLARQLAGWAGTLLVVWFGFEKAKVGFAADQRLNGLLDSVAATNAAIAGQGLSQARIVVLGPAIPIEAAAYLSGTRIIAQVLPPSADLLDQLPPDDWHAVLTREFGDRAQIAWRTDPDGGVQFVVIPPRP